MTKNIHAGYPLVIEIDIMNLCDAIKTIPCVRRKADCPLTGLLTREYWWHSLLSRKFSFLSIFRRFRVLINKVITAVVVIEQEFSTGRGSTFSTLLKPYKVSADWAL